MHEQLGNILRQLKSAETHLRRVAHDTPDARWAVRRDPERWSVAECVAHLNLTGRAYVPLLRAGLDDARALGTPAPRRYRRDPVGWLVARTTGSLLGVGKLRFGRMRTVPAFVPTGDLAREPLVAEFERLQSEQMSLVEQGDGLPLHAVRVVSPFDPRVHYNLYACMTMLAPHQERHLTQAERVWAS